MQFARGQEGSTLPLKSELGIMENTKTIKGKSILWKSSRKLLDISQRVISFDDKIRDI